MEIDFAGVAAAIATFLAPFTPYLVEGEKKFVSKAGEVAWNKAQQIWQRLSSEFKNDPKITGAALAVSADPADNDACSFFAKAIALRLRESQDFTGEMMDMLGGQDVVQEILVENKSWAEKVKQEIIGDAGIQTVKVKNASVAIGLHQRVEKKRASKK